MIIEDWAYQNERVALIPYASQWPVFPDGLLGHLYLRTKQDKRLELVFDHGINFDKFVTYLSKKSLALQIYCLKTEDQLIPCGYCWVDDFAGAEGARRAMFGLCFFKEYRGRPEVAELGWLSLAYWFRELHIDVLYGITMASNLQALLFARRFSFTTIGTCPRFLYRQGELTDAKVVLLERERFEEICPKPLRLQNETA